MLGPLHQGLAASLAAGGREGVEWAKEVAELLHGVPRGHGRLAQLPARRRLEISIFRIAV